VDAVHAGLDHQIVIAAQHGQGIELKGPEIEKTPPDALIP
jgi:hypothetical protein